MRSATKRVTVSTDYRNPNDAILYPPCHVSTVCSGSALALGCGRSFDPESVPESKDRFPRTPIAGDMTQTRIVIAFHVADDSPVTLRIWTDLDTVVDQKIAPSGDGFHKVRSMNSCQVQPITMPCFRKSPKLTARSLIGTVKTAWSEDSLDPVRIAIMACIGQGSVLPDFYFPESTGNETKVLFEWDLKNTRTTDRCPNPS